MRNFILIICLCICSSALADGFIVFEKDGYFGIKDQTGNVTVPAVYEKLGWSSGSSEVINGVIGFRQNNLWGLITVRNKSLTGQKFYSIEPIAKTFFKASIKGKFSNHLFHGILDYKGKTIISFNYFTIEPLGADWLVSSFDGQKQRFGVVTYQNELAIPTRYRSVSDLNNLYLGRRTGGKLDLYNKTGDLLELGLDSALYININGYLVYRDGFAGYLLASGQQLYNFEYKTFEFNEGSVKPISFPEWTIYQADTIVMKWRCDSIDIAENGMFAAYLNGAQHLLLKNRTLLENHELILKEYVNNQLIVQNSKTRKWSILSDEGKSILTGYDSIHSMNDFYAASNEKGWWLVDLTGKISNRLSFQELKKGIENQFVIKKNDHWGILDRESEDVSTFKYDSISVTGDKYVVSYLNKKGLMSKDGNWIVRPEYDNIGLLGNMIFARKGQSFSYFSDGNSILKTTSKPVALLGNGYLVQNENGYGLLNTYGEFDVYPAYDSIFSMADFFVLKERETVKLISPLGETIIYPQEGYQEFSNYGEGYFAVKRENRWGFVDDQGRLRISNRYDSVSYFKEGMAPIMLRKKWGFIDKNETLTVQPYYDAVNHFLDGLAVVKQRGKYGLINNTGEEVLELKWKTILRLNSGNYLVQDIEGHFGLLNNQGGFILRPSFDYLEDFGDRVLVSKNGYWGILDYSGGPIFKINHKAIKVKDDFTMVRK